MGLLSRKRLPHIVAGFEKTLGELENLQKENNEGIQEHEERVAHHRSRRDEMIEENVKAGAVASNIRRLLQA